MITPRFASWTTLPWLLISAGISLLGATGSQARDFTFQERVAGQEAIDRVYYSHQIGANRPFEEAEPRWILEGKVHAYLKLSVALERIWKTPVTSEMLDREMARMARETRMPDRLRELYQALDNDPAKIREFLARPVLVRRLARNFFDFDHGIHEGARREGEELQERLLGRWIDPSSLHQGRTVLRLVRVEPKQDSSQRESAAGESIDPLSTATRKLDPGEFDAWKERADGWAGGVSPLSEERGAFVIRALLGSSPREIRLAVYTVAKRRWEAWWGETEPAMDEGSFKAPAASAAGLTLPARGGEGGQEGDPAAAGGRFEALLSSTESCDPDNSWQALTSPGDAPAPRYYYTAVWTGSLMLVWGGYGDFIFNTGGRYDPATDTWSPTSLVGAPLARYSHTAVWTGSEMIIWGGNDGSEYLGAGGRYDPASDTWSPVSSGPGEPAPRTGHAAVWTGSEMIIWGGTPQTGARYDPAADSWAPVSTLNAPAAYYGQVAVWTGNRMIVWGGGVSTGGRYDPATDTWQPTSVTNAPEGRSGCTAIWTGNQMIVWGGSGVSSQWLNTGGRYDPVADSWSATSTSGAPAGRYGHVAVWTGSRMVIWGGRSGWPYPPGFIATGGRYDPSTDTWSPTSTVNAPAGRYLTRAIWTGSRMVVWGGSSSLGVLNSGGRYDPATDSWTPTSGAAALTPRRYHTSLWTGSLVLIWGGYKGVPLDTGARYDPATSTWTPITQTGAPEARYGHTAVWTGSEMIVWGGVPSDSVLLDSGGRYNPVTDTWLPVSLSGAPAGRYRHTAVWTGSRMIIWGGHAVGSTNTGGRYNPSDDTWEPTSLLGAPSPRELHVAVWTGSRMVVWGGLDQTGGLYDPIADSWTATSLTGAPPARQAATAIWTGSLMVVWGGGYSTPSTNSGGRYDPVADTWSPTSLTFAPSPRTGHTAVWTGHLMLVWGGTDGSGFSGDTGGRYEPITDTWTPMSTADAPSARSNHTATWIGDRMLVWGGDGLATLGGLYCTCATAAYFLDSDGDGFGSSSSFVHACSQPSGYVTNRLDCVDSNPGAWTAPSEVLDLTFEDEQTLTWSPPLDPGGTSIFFDVIRSDDPADFVDAATCVMTAGATSTGSDAALPGPGSLFSYLARGRNNCPGALGLGSLGSRSDGTPRTAVSCP